MTTTKTEILRPDDAAVLVRHVEEQLHQARSGLIVPGGGITDVNGAGA